MLDYKIKPIPPSHTYEWLLKKHYAHRIPPLKYTFGLFKNNVLEGVCCYANPMSWSLQIGICGKKYSKYVLELNRLVLNENKKNLASYFISQTFKLLPRPLIIVSYSDTAQNHHGYIYQACNFIYTGTSKPFKEYAMVGQENKHAATIGDMVGRSDKIGKGFSKFKLLKEKFGDKVYWKERSLKHRYLYFLGNKLDTKEMKKNLKYKIFSYPKGDNKKYDASYQPALQKSLF